MPERRPRGAGRGPAAPSKPKIAVLPAPFDALSSYIQDVIAAPLVRRLALGSRKGVARELRILAESSLGQHPLNELSKVMVWQCWSQHEGRGFPSPANKQRQYLRQVLRMACNHDLITKDPSVGLKRMKEPTDRVRWLTDEQRAAILKEAARTNPRVFRYIWLAMHTIVRRGSLCHVTKADIDLTTGTIVYRRTKNGVEIRVPLIPVCLDEVKAWLAEPGPLLISTGARLASPKPSAGSRTASRSRAPALRARLHVPRPPARHGPPAGQAESTCLSSRS